MATWYPMLGWGVFWFGLIGAIIAFATTKKWSPIMYIISVCTYIFTVGFVIDVFDIGKNGILLILALSAVLMIGMGTYLSKRFKK